VKLPDAGECFDYAYDPASKEWINWEQKVQPYSPVVECMFQNIVVSNVDLERLKYILDLNMQRRKPVLFVGVAGTGKTTFVKDYLAEMKAKNEDMINMAINNNSYTTSFALQTMIMGCLDKRTGKTYGPPGNKKCLFFIDDLNMPHVDKYDTQSAIMLLTQILSYSQVYDRANLEEKREIVDVLFTSCMNPKAGSFMINARLQRHFTVLTAFTPTASLIKSIYSQILGNHLRGFAPPIQKLQEGIVSATIDTFAQILNTACFLPSAPKFHYQFNLKAISSIFQGLLKTASGLYRDGSCRFVQVWLHECLRTCSDRLINAQDHSEMRSILEKNCSKHFPGISGQELFLDPLIVTSFVTQAEGNDKAYVPVKDMTLLKKVVEAKLSDHNESHAAMDLVLFADAIAHTCRISRIIDNPCGNSLLIGVGGSGKQSLGRLASYINEQDVVRILVN
jgi:dynein heavy chain